LKNKNPTETLSETDSSDAHLAKLLTRCDQGHEIAFEELYTLTSARLYGILLRILKSETLADEALQETFVKIWRKAGSYKPQSGMAITWLRSIARNQALDQLRRWSVREKHEYTDMVGVIDSTPSAIRRPDEMDMGGNENVLLQCLDKLPESTQRCIVLAYCEGYSHVELAEQQDAPIGTVKSWIRRGLESLRKCIDEFS